MSYDALLNDDLSHFIESEVVPADVRFIDLTSQHVYHNGELYRRPKKNRQMIIGADVQPNLTTASGLDNRILGCERRIAPCASAVAKLT